MPINPDTHPAFERIPLKDQFAIQQKNWRGKEKPQPKPKEKTEKKK